MNKEERENVYRVYYKLAADSIELGQVISTLPTGEDAEHLSNGAAKIRNGLGILLFLLETEE